METKKQCGEVVLLQNSIDYKKCEYWGFCKTCNEFHTKIKGYWWEFGFNIVKKSVLNSNEYDCKKCIKKKEKETRVSLIQLWRVKE